MSRKLNVIADEIRKEWAKPYFGAVPYIDAMSQVESITDRYIAETGKDLVLGFLCNCSSWRGDAARRIKAELKELLR